MNVSDYLIYCIEAAKMDVSGVIIGLVAGTVSIIHRVNGMGFKLALSVFLSGGFLGGYSLPILLKKMPLLAYILTAGISYIAYDFLQALKNISPGLVSTVLGKIQGYLKLKDNDK